MNGDGSRAGRLRMVQESQEPTLSLQPQPGNRFSITNLNCGIRWSAQAWLSLIFSVDSFAIIPFIFGYPRSPQTFLRTGPNRTATIAPLPLSPTSSASSPLRQHGSCVPTSRLQNGFPHLGHVDVCSAQRVAMQSPEHELMGLFKHATETRYPSYPCSSDTCLFQSRINR